MTLVNAIENAKTLDELVSVDAQMQKELGLSMLLGFGLTTDLADSSRSIAADALRPWRGRGGAARRCVL